MNLLDTRLYRWLDTVSDFFLLNLLWLLACVPIITIFPATAALFAVVRDWVKGKETGFFKSFFRYMRENFGQSLAVGLTWTVVGLVLLADFLFVRSITSWARTPLLVLVLSLGVIYLATAVYIFPVMAQYHAGWLHIIKNSFIIAISSPITTISAVLLVLLTALVVYYLPVVLLLFGSVPAYFLYRLCHRVFRQIETVTAVSNEETQQDNPI
ncbi:MAG: DUF624 domain-containing protein [Ardenticatenaceae bacterium]|nr:DUF624 domain-containing protein [Ardenticatenaceae bacterium]